jgi:hypothetical protein
MSDVVQSALAVRVQDNRQRYGYLILTGDRLVHVHTRGAYLASVSFGLLGAAVVSAITRGRAQRWADSPPDGSVVVLLSDVTAVKKGQFRMARNILAVQTSDGSEHVFGARYKKWQPLLSGVVGSGASVEPA